MNDTISRQAAIDILDAYTVKIENKEEYAYSWARMRFSELPSAQPERKGKWIDGWRSRFDGTRYWYRECSECGYERDDDNPEKDTNCCPNCGAKMEGEEDD